MYSRIRRRRFLGLMLRGSSSEKGLAPKAAVIATTGKGVAIPPEFTPRQYAIFLLHVAAELEHVLMVEYLYAAYSLGGEQVPLEHQAEVTQWREVILGIAKEEMGHLMTVQNLLRCLGGPLNLDREDYPWDSEFYPFPFKLEPLTRASVAKYVVAESPAPDLWTGPEADEIRILAEKDVEGAAIHRVGELYDTIEALFADPRALQDDDFRGSTYPFQANWDEWGRGYKGGARGNTTGAAMPGTPDVILKPVTARTDSLAALRAVATQGEATSTSNDDAPSHFARFLHIYRQMPKDEAWSPSRKVPVDPVVLPETLGEKESVAWPGTRITHPTSKAWANLFNVRYRLLLTNLLHTFEYPGNLSEGSQRTPRGLLLHATFGEMYNLRALSQILVEAPLSEDGSTNRAGPPFQMPYTLKFPLDSGDRWRQHLDLLRASRLLVDRLLDWNPDEQRSYLLALRKVDDETATIIESILEGHPVSLSATDRHH
jgi:Ferritin-like